MSTKGKTTAKRNQSLIPTTAKQLSHRTLREGEHTGHAHVATNEEVVLFSDADLERMYMLVPPDGTSLVHEEHGAQHIAGGERQVGAVREYDYDAEEAREVID